MSKVWFITGAGSGIGTGIERFGIKLTLVEPGFFRTDLLDARNVKWPSKAIADYTAEGNVQETWSAYNGTQQGDPAKLGEVLIKIAGMKDPPKQFYAGSDALAVIRPALEARLREIRDHEELSKSTDGTF